MENKNSNLKKNNVLQSLLSEGKRMEEKIIASRNLNSFYMEEPENEEAFVQASDFTPPTRDVTQVKNQNSEQGFSIFTKERRKEKEVVMVAASRYQRDQLKITATALGINMQDLIANIFDNFFETNQTEIREARKSLLG
jgi:predicted DNA binding CopG/RHH family protein